MKVFEIYLIKSRWRFCNDPLSFADTSISLPEWRPNTYNMDATLLCAAYGDKVHLRAQ